MHDLSPAQLEAVRHESGPLLVKAGPGTGKTRTLTHRIAYLVEKRGVDPASIAALTFTHRAAGEMGERLTALLGKERAEAIFIGTFHAFGWERVRASAGSLGFDAPPVLYDEEDQRALMGEVLKKFYPGPGSPSAEKVLRLVQSLVSRGLEPSGEESSCDLKKVWERYKRKKREEGAVDFDDLIALTRTLLRDGGADYRHLFVDEYQDVNPPQVEVIRLLAERADSLMAIGDPDQAIYSFRGSGADSFKDFQRIFPGTRTFRLEKNYRSSVTIVHASNQLIRGAPAPAKGGTHVRVELHVLPTDKAEAVFLSRKIEALCGGISRYGLEGGLEAEDEEFGFGEIAVLYRLNAQAREIEKAFERSGIPFQRVGRERAGLETAERAVLAAMRLALDPENPAARRVTAGLGRKERSLASDEARKRIDSLGGERNAVLDYLDAAPLRRREDPFEARCEKVTLSTMHAAKGLEFPVVFIAGLEEGLVPYIRDDDPDQEAARQEERRLLYVGMTRARSRLYLVRAEQRFLFGKRLDSKASPFLSDISDDLLRFVRERKRPKKKPTSPDEGKGQMSLF